MGKNSPERSEVNEESPQEDSPPSRGLSLVDFVMRIVGAISTMGSAIAMGTTGQSPLPSFAQFVRFRAHYQDFPTFKFFVATNALATAYLVVSLLISIFHIFKTGAKVTRAVLIILDTMILSLLTAAASATAGIAYLAHKGNDRANWSAICEQYNSFCERSSGSLVGSFIGVLLLMLLVFLSALALSRN